MHFIWHGHSPSSSSSSVLLDGQGCEATVSENTSEIHLVCVCVCVYDNDKEKLHLQKSREVKCNDKSKLMHKTLSYPSNMAPNFFATWDLNSGVVPSSLPSCSCFETSVLCKEVNRFIYIQTATENLSKYYIN